MLMGGAFSNIFSQDTSSKDQEISQMTNPYFKITNKNYFNSLLPECLAMLIKSQSTTSLPDAKVS